jgi:hypothetical protein
MVILPNGKVGIGTSNPSEKLEVIGYIRANGFIYTSSDRKLKKNIKTIKNPLEKILRLRGVDFN